MICPSPEDWSDALFNVGGPRRRGRVVTRRRANKTKKAKRKQREKSKKRNR